LELAVTIPPKRNIKAADAVKRIHERTGHPADEVHPIPLSV